MTQDDPRWSDTHGHRGLDVFPVPDAQRLAADDAGHVEPAYEADTHEQHQDRTAEDHHEQDQHEHVGDGHQHVDDAHHHAVEPPAEVARGRAVEGADDHRDQGPHHADHQRDARSLHGAGEQVAPQLVHAEPVAVRERRRPLLGDVAENRPVDLLVGPRSHQIAEECEGRDERKRDEARHRGTIAQEAGAGVLPERAAVLGCAEPRTVQRPHRASSEERRHRPRLLECSRSSRLRQVSESGFPRGGTRLRQVRSAREVLARNGRRACIVGPRRSLASTGSGGRSRRTGDRPRG